MFCRRTGNPLTDHDVWLQFRRITERAGLSTDWSPRELRHIRLAPVRLRRLDRADRECGRPLQHLDNRERLPAPAPACPTDCCYRAGPVVRRSRERKPECQLGCQLGCAGL
ncbi:MAG: hypothetical protein ACLQFR_00270 [Streptosporangiaceae bacterium]